MRCVDVIAELAVSTPDATNPAPVAEHLAHCPRCAAWAGRDAKLQRLWEATRPEEPSASAWATVWGQVTQALDSAPVPAMAPPLTLRPAPAAARPWRRWGVAAFGIAQAAVLLVAAWFVSGPDGNPRPQGARPGTELASTLDPSNAGLIPSTAGPDVEIESGTIVMIESGPEGVKVVRQLIDESSTAVDAGFVAIGIFEAMAE